MTTETDTERQQRSRENLCKLQFLTEKYNIRLCRNYSIDDDPDDMQCELDMISQRIANSDRNELHCKYVQTYDMAIYLFDEIMTSYRKKMNN